MTRKFRLFLCSATALLLAACGGSSSPTTSNNGSGTAPPALTTGRVTVLLTDAPGRDWDQAIATITSIELMGESRNVSIFDGESVVDLLALQDFYEVFSVTEGIFPGTFDKIRLMLSSLELVDLNDDGVEIERVEAKIVGNGKMDLNPRDDIVIAAGDTLYIEIDFDMNKAFKTTTTGQGRVIVRPVVMVNVTAEPPATRLTRVRGTIEEIDAEDNEFELCQEGLVGEMDDDDDDNESDHNECLDVIVGENTGLFGADGMPIEFGDLEVGDIATAIGFLRRESEEDDDDDDDGDSDSHGELELEAITVEIGEAFVRVAGVAGGAVGGDVFDLAVDPGQEIGTDDETLSTQIFPGTHIVRVNGDELDQTAILAGVGVTADGVIVPDESLPDTLRAALLILDPDRELDEDVLSGEIVSINTEDSTLQLMVDDAEQCINASEAAIFLVSNIDGFSSEEVELGDLEPMMLADVFGEGEDEDGCFIASDILASAIAGNTLPVANAGDDQSVDTGAGVSLDGSASSDDDGDPLTYAWTLTSVPEGSTAALIGADTAMPTFTADLAGEYVVELIVNDGAEDSAPDEVVITASTP